MAETLSGTPLSNSPARLTWCSPCASASSGSSSARGVHGITLVRPPCSPGLTPRRKSGNGRCRSARLACTDPWVRGHGLQPVQRTGRRASQVDVARLLMTVAEGTRRLFDRAPVIAPAIRRRSIALLRATLGRTRLLTAPDGRVSSSLRHRLQCTPACRNSLRRQRAWQPSRSR